jgi:hypothetical protein
MTGTTSPNGIVYPNDYDQPADVPNDMQAMANSIQTALNLKQNTAPTTTAFDPSSGWVNNDGSAYQGLKFAKIGRLVVASGRLTRSSPLTVADNTLYLLGTVKVAWRPVVAMRFPAAWRVNQSGSHNMRVTQLDILTDGTLSLVSDRAAIVDDSTDWVSVGGIVWLTA